MRLTVLGPNAVVHLDRTWSPLDPAHPPVVAEAAPRVFDLGGDLTPDRFEVCFARSLLPVALRGSAPEGANASPATFVVFGKSFAVDETRVCFENGDVASPALVVVAHWNAPDGTRVVVEGGAATPLDLRSDPARALPAILALVTAP